MRAKMKFIIRLTLLGLVFVSFSSLVDDKIEPIETTISSSAQTWRNLQYNQDQPGLEYNPLKGFTTLWGAREEFPYSIKGHLFGLNDVMTGLNSFNWTIIDNALSENASKGIFSYIQVNIDPAIPGVIDMPDYLFPLVDTIHTPEGVCPNWNDEDLMTAMLNFIEAYGERYNDDYRVFLVHFGLYGMWGEWHVGQYGKEYEMTVKNQARLSDAYLKAFPDKQLLARYPTLPDNQIVGYSDGMFFGQSIGENPWFFHNILKEGNAEKNWKLHAIGGEIQPNLQAEIWDEWPNTVGQDVRACMDSIHPSWLISYHVLNNVTKGTSEFDNAIRAQKMMGYTLFINKYRLTAQEGTPVVEVGIRNNGIAPMYADWDIEIGVLDAQNQFQSLGIEKWNLKNILPGENDYYRVITGDTSISDGTYKVLVRIVNPLEEISAKAKPVRFANTTQDANIEGWLTLGEMVIVDGNCGETPIRTNSVSVNQDSVNLAFGETFQLTATVAPENASFKKITWVSDHPNSVDVDSTGLLTAGNVMALTKIYAYTQDGGHVAEITVNVKPVWNVIPGKIEAEDYISQSGIQTENTADIGGGLNVGWIDDGDWMQYPINNTSDSIYFKASFRLSAPASGGHIYIYVDEIEIGELFVPNTGSWQNWKSVLGNLRIDKGNHIFKIVANKGGFNFNYVKFDFGPEVDDYVPHDINFSSKILDDRIIIYPMPAGNNFTINADGIKFNQVKIIDLNGKTIYCKGEDDQSVIDVSVNIDGGIYFLQLKGNDQVISKKIILKN